VLAHRARAANAPAVEGLMLYYTGKRGLKGAEPEVIARPDREEGWSERAEDG
jgi:hypothetical protein